MSGKGSKRRKENTEQIRERWPDLRKKSVFEVITPKDYTEENTKHIHECVEIVEHILGLYKHEH